MTALTGEADHVKDSCSDNGRIKLTRVVQMDQERRMVPAVFPN
jgi:hypothetical protein